MSEIEIDAALRYAVHAPSSFALVIAAASSGRQHVADERLVVEPSSVGVSDVRIGDPPHGLARFTAGPGEIAVRYHALVTTSPYLADVAPAVELAFAELPDEVLSYLNPSRYCESDMLVRFATARFGSMHPGYERVSGVCNWVYDHLEYVAGSTDATTTATDVLVQGAGVCRDYAHLSIALCRALGIPARYVSGYAVDLQPQDFHGFFEAFLAGEWYLFDATRMAPMDGLVRIGVGRDAADAAFATFVGSATLIEKTITVVDRAGTGVRPLESRPIATA